jgi:uncharacterized protein YycO
MLSQKTRILARLLGMAASFAGAYFLYLMISGESPVLKQDTETSAEETDAWIDEIQAKGADGDWIVVRGYKVSDHLIAGTTFTKLTHAVVLDHENMQVVEAIKPKVRVVSVREIVENAHRVVLIRPDSAQEAQGPTALEKARSRVGQPYDFLGVIGLPSKKKFYCSELAVWAWGIEVDRAGPTKVVHPAALRDYGKVLFDSGPRHQ